jgi:NAD(P)-dependent dehydrogenase (short-subunit alcohol dehydrogenase family)
VRVLVTGASGAFGSGTMRALAARGDRAVGLDVKPSDGVLACDLTDDGQVADAVARVREELGGLDAVVHFAGIGIPNDAGGPVDDAVLRTVQVNLLGAWRVTHATLPALVESRGRLVYTASELAYAVLPFVSAYSVAKRGLAAYADAVRFEYGSRISVTTVYPGYVPTPIHDVGLSMGLSLEGKVRKEKVENVVGTVMKALTARRPRRDTAATLAGDVELRLARHAPRLVEAAIRARTRLDVRRGTYDGVPLARGLVARLGKERRVDEPTR